MDNAPVVFVDDDQGYRIWLEANPNGLVLNSYRKPKPEYLVLHRASCGHVNTSQRENWTTNEFIKICSPKLIHLENWASEHGGSLSLCGHCLSTKGMTPNPASGFTDSLRGYTYQTHQRGEFVCCYCGLDGRQSFENWIRLSQEHLLPKGNPDRDNPEYIVTACSFCNIADNRFFDYAEKRGLQITGRSAEDLIRQRLPFVAQVRANYQAFWNSQVRLPEQPNVSNDNQVTVDRIDMGTGWAVFQGGENPPPPNQLAGYLTDVFNNWLKNNPAFKVRVALPIVVNGNTVAINVWFE